MDADTTTAVEIERVSRRGAWALALVIAGSVVALLSTLNTWVERQALDTDSWVDATDALLADDEVRASLAVYLVDELYESVDVGAAISDLLPPDFENLGGVVAGALRGSATDAVDRVLETDVVRDAWSAANRAAHETLIAVIDDDTGDVLSTAGGVVSIDLGELVRAVGERVGLGADTLDGLADDAGELVLFESDELEVVQDAARLVTYLSAFLFLLVLALFAGAIYISGDRRRTVRDCGVGLVVVGLLALFARTVGIGAVVDNLSRAGDDEPAQSILDIGSTLLRQIALTQVLVGLALVVFAVLAGPTQVAQRIRGLLVPALRHGTVAAVVGGILVFGLLVWIKPGGPLNGWIIALATAALCVAGVAWVQRVTMDQHRDAMAVPEGDG